MEAVSVCEAKNKIDEPLLAGEPFAYRTYDCRTGTLGTPIEVAIKKLNIIEGTYSLHPTFADVIDLAVFMEIDEELQRERIKKRNPDKYERFMQEWIPKEREYFSKLRKNKKTCIL